MRWKKNWFWDSLNRIYHYVIVDNIISNINFRVISNIINSWYFGHHNLHFYLQKDILQVSADVYKHRKLLFLFWNHLPFHQSVVWQLKFENFVKTKKIESQNTFDKFWLDLGANNGKSNFWRILGPKSTFDNESRTLQKSFSKFQNSITT